MRICLAMIVVLLVCAHKPTTAGPPPLGLVARAEVINIVDGDTVDLMVSMPLRVRLLDCWAPEIHGAEKPLGMKSKQYLEHISPIGTKVQVQIPSTDASSLASVFTFGRLLGHVWTDGEDKSLSQRMVGAGMATTEKVKP